MTDRQHDCLFTYVNTVLLLILVLHNYRVI